MNGMPAHADNVSPRGKLPQPSSRSPPRAERHSCEVADNRPGTGNSKPHRIRATRSTSGLSRGKNTDALQMFKGFFVSTYSPYFLFFYTYNSYTIRVPPPLVRRFQKFRYYSKISAALPFFVVNFAVRGYFFLETTFHLWEY